jgi:hypothetical protein
LVPIICLQLQIAKWVVVEVDMKSLFGLLFALGCVEVCSGQYDQRIAPLKDAPFSAQGQTLSTHPKSSSVWTADMARASDGSIYEATFEPVGEFKGTIQQVRIRDAVNHCSIGISPYRSNLTRTDQGQVVEATLGMTIVLAAEKASDSPSPSIKDIRDKNLREQRRISRCSLPCKPDAKVWQTSLGERTVSGMTIFGFGLEHHADSRTDRIDEHWESELGFTYSYKSIDPTDGSGNAYSFTGLKLAEPPAELFTVQDKYFPPSRTLANARTIFISGPLGDAELTHRIESILTASGRFTLIADKNTADLVVSNHKLFPRPDQPDAPDGTDSLRLSFDKPKGGNLFWLTLNFDGAVDQWAQSPVVNTCFANVWKRVETYQAPVAVPLDDEWY